MIVDSSALVAVAFEEPGHEALIAALQRADWAAMGAPTAAETGIVIMRRFGSQRHWVAKRLIEKLNVRIRPFDERHLAEALLAHERFGRGRHAAQLNFGDCLCYATAKLASAPLLCVGDDFAKTDLDIVRLNDQT